MTRKMLIMSYEKMTGIVIKEVAVGDSDKILTVLTGEEGRIAVSVKNAKKIRSGTAAGTSFLSYNEFTLYKGKSMYILNHIGIIESFYKLREDLVALTYASYFAEILYYNILENEPCKEVLKLFLNTLHFLANTGKDKRLLKIIFEFRILCMLGYAPYFNDYNEYDRDYFFSYDKCGIAEHGGGSCVKISKGEIQAIRHITGADLNSIFSFNVSEEVLTSLSEISETYLCERTERSYKSLEILKNVGLL